MRMGHPMIPLVVILALLAPTAAAQYYDLNLPRRAEEYARARAEYRNARLERNRARSQLRAKRAEVRQRVESNPRLERAQMALAEAQDAYYDLREQVMRKVREDQTYKHAKEQARDIQAEIDSLHDQPGELADSRIRDLARQKLRWESKADAVKSRIMDEHPDIEKLQDQMIEARDELDRIETELQRKVDDQADVKQARDMLRDNRDDLTDARADLTAARAGYLAALRQQRVLLDEVIITDDDIDIDLED